tara:strand:+ start:414 stop:623 length:210 start_codon:yes stop_codon:yes gene_type:complete
MDVQDRLRLAHISVCKAENERMREVFGIRNYKEGDQWTAQKNRQVTGAEGGRQKNLKRLWVKERAVQCK